MMLRRRTDGTRRGDMGFTLIELLITSVILPIVLSAAYLVFITLSGDYSIISAQSEATSEAQRAMDTMVREMRQEGKASFQHGAFAITRHCNGTIKKLLEHREPPGKQGDGTFSL